MNSEGILANGGSFLNSGKSAKPQSAVPPSDPHIGHQITLYRPCFSVD
jgi:hypothetical protein